MTKWQEYFHNAREMVETIEKRLTTEGELIRYVNLRYKLTGEQETKWLYDVVLTLWDDTLTLKTGDGQLISLALADLAYIKLRPYYYAACVGFKEFAFYAYPEPANENEQ